MTPKNALWVSPYTLVYGKEAILPPNILLPSLQLSQASRGSGSQVLQSRIDTLLQLEEARQKAKDRFHQHQDIVKRWFDKRKSGKRSFEVGDLVLKWDHNHEGKGMHMKFQHLWVGPYQISAKIGPSTYKLINLEGEEVALPLNGLALKQYFA